MIIILENVKNLQSHNNGNTFKIISDNIQKLGYHIKYNIINTRNITNIPQNRERIYIVCFKDKLYYDKFNFDFKSVKTNSIVNYLEQNIPNQYYYSNRFKIYDKIKNEITQHINSGIIYQYRRYYVRQNNKGVCPTLTANMGSGGHNVPLLLDDYGIRKLTPRECFNLQGFPLNYKLPNISDNKLYTLAGNAVSIPVIELLSKKIFKSIQ